MTMVKSLILGSAAGLVAMSGAQAADLPVKAKAVEYVRICSLYGAGFYYIPGTDTCIKLAGYLRVDTTFNGGTTVSRPLAAISVRATATAITSPPVPVWQLTLIPAPPPNTASSAPSVRATSVPELRNQQPDPLVDLPGLELRRGSFGAGRRLRRG